MKKKLLTAILLLSTTLLSAQQQEGRSDLCILPRTNVITYGSANAIEKQRYLESANYHSLSSSWQSSQAEYGKAYRQTLEVPKEWKNFQVCFRMLAAPGYGLSVNGVFIGTSSDSRSFVEYDISSLLKFGKTNILEVSKQGEAQGDLLEIQRAENQGLFGESAILLKPQVNVLDYSVRADYHNGMGSLVAHIDLFNTYKKGKYYVEIELWDPKGHSVDKFGKWCLFSNRTEGAVDIQADIPRVLPWSAEQPKLYTVVLRLRDENMNLVDLVGTRVGFRTIEVANGKLLLNGIPITLQGVVFSPQGSLASSAALEDVKSQLVALRQHNVNAIRTAVNSPVSARFYELCDELGFYVVCDANIKPTSTADNVVAADPQFVDLFVGRVSHMYHQYKNQTSILGWSLGDSQDNGVCMVAAYKELKRLEKNRPIICSAAQYSENTDIIAPCNASDSYLRQYGAKQPSRPLVMLSYGSARGNSFGGIEALWQIVNEQKSVVGGFYNCWEQMQGKPYMLDLKHLYRPFDIRMVGLSADQAEFSMSSRTSFRHLSDYKLTYVICSNLRPNIIEGDIPFALNPGAIGSFKLKVPKMDLPLGEELFVRFLVRQRHAISGVGKDYLVYTQQVPLYQSEKKRTSHASHAHPLAIHHDTISNENVRLIFDRQLGQITSIRYHQYELLEKPLKVNFWRAATDNDWHDVNGTQQWGGLSPDVVQCQVLASHLRTLSDGSVGIDVMLRYNRPEGIPICDVRQTYLILPESDILIRNEIVLSDAVRALPKLGMQLGVTHDFAKAEWLGRKSESYPDRHFATAVDQQTMLIDQLFYRYEKPQDAGNRTDVRWASFSNDEVGLYVDMLDTLFNFSIYPYNDEDLFNADNYNAVMPTNWWTLNTDYKVMGVGSGLADFSTQESSLLTDRKYSFTLHLRPYQVGEEPSSRFYSFSMPEVQSGVLEMPTISKNRERFNAPMLITLSSKVPKSEIRYTLDGTVPTEQSPLYKAPFTIKNSTVVSARVFKSGEAPSFTAVQQFNFDYVSATTFSHKPNTPYNRNSERALFDGELGEVNDLSRGWLGFSCSDVQIDLELTETIDVEKVLLRFAHVPDAWVFAPAQVTLSVSSDGVNYSQPIEAVIDYQPASVEMNASQLKQLSVTISQSAVRYVRVYARSIGRIPAWHRAKGLKPWIMTDEIQLVEKIKAGTR